MFGFLRRWFPERDTTLRESEDASWNKFVEEEGVTYIVSPRVEKVLIPARMTVHIVADSTHAEENYEFEPGDILWKIFSDHKNFEYYRGAEVCRNGWYYIEREKNPIPRQILESILDCGMASECLSTRFSFPILVKEEDARPSSANTN